MKELFLTEQEIHEIEKLRENTIADYIKNLDDDKKRLVIRQYEKESAIRQLKTIVNESY